MIAKKPVSKTGIVIRYNFVKLEHEYHYCPVCGGALNAGPDYYPDFCEKCGQTLDFSRTEWKEDRQIGFVEPEAV